VYNRVQGSPTIRNPSKNSFVAAFLLTFVFVVFGCQRYAPCEGNTCGGHGTCRVEFAPKGEDDNKFRRYDTEKLVEVCDCNGKEGFEFRNIGCGPASEFESCMPVQCESYVTRCELNEVCLETGPDTSPVCAECPSDKIPEVTRLGCEYPLCQGLNLTCPNKEACQADGKCGPCLPREVFDEQTRRCRPCPKGFTAVDGRCEAKGRRAYLVTKLQILNQNRVDVFGALNANGFFREYWFNETDDGYNMIWDQDLLLVMVFSEFEDVLDKDIPDAPTATELSVYNGLFVSSRIWEEVRGQPEPKELRDSRRKIAPENYASNSLSGEECARSVGVDCNPGHFRGDDLLEAKYFSSFECSPKLANIDVKMSKSEITTMSDKAWLVMPYEQSDLLLQAYQLKIELQKQPTGLCLSESNDLTWPCMGYEGTMKFALRAVDLIESFRKGSGGGISEDFFSAILGEPDVDQDGDGSPDSFSVQVNVDLTPIQFVGTTTTSSVSFISSP